MNFAVSWCVLFCIGFECVMTMTADGMSQLVVALLSGSNLQMDPMSGEWVACRWTVSLLMVVMFARQGSLVL